MPPDVIDQTAVAANSAATAAAARKAAKKARKKADDAKAKMEEAKKQADEAEADEAEDAEDTRKAADEAEEEYKMLAEEADEAEASAKKAEDEEENDEEEKKDKDKEARRAARLAGQRSQQADTQRIASLCTLAGHKELFADFVKEGLTVAQVEKKLHDLRAEASNARRIDANFGVIGPVSSSTIDVMDKEARALSRSTGISVAKAYQQLLTENPGLYQDYLDEREAAVLTSKGKREYLSQLQMKFASQGRGTQVHVNRDNLPQRGFANAWMMGSIAIVALIVCGLVAGVGLGHMLLAAAAIGLIGMAWEGIQQNWTFPAGVDLSAKQFYAVIIDGSGNLQLANSGKNCDGILQDKPILNQAGLVCRDGVTKARITGGITVGIGSLLQVDSGGTLTTWTTANTAVARALEAGTATGTFVITVELLRSATAFH